MRKTDLQRHDRHDRKPKAESIAQRRTYDFSMKIVLDGVQERGSGLLK